MISRDLMIFLLSFWLREKINMNHIHIHTTYEHITNQTYKMNKWSISRHIDFVFLYLLLKDHDQWPWSEANAFGNWCNWINIHYFLIINAWCAPIYSMYQSPMSNYLLVKLMMMRLCLCTHRGHEWHCSWAVMSWAYLWYMMVCVKRAEKNHNHWWPIDALSEKSIENNFYIRRAQ